MKDLIPYIKGPSRYLGNEINTIHKDLNKIEVKFALCFPDLYEVGMSHLGLQILYYILNQDPRIAAERVFAPDIDMEKKLRKYNIPLCTLESNIPLKDCDIVGFSLQHELCFTNVLNILNLGHIPLYSRQRNENHPLIIGGGPISVNPEPISPFLDGFIVGDGEEVILEIVNVYLSWKKEGGKREELLKDLTKIPGFYLPFAFYPRYHLDGTIKEIEELLPHYHKVKRQIIKDLDSAPFPTFPIIPYNKPIHDRLSIEVTRGCTHGCRFCQAGFIYRPVRERSPQKIFKLIEESIKNTGYEEVSLLSLSIGDYCPLKDFLPSLMDELSSKEVALSLPSLRVGTIDKEIMEQISRVRRTGFTFAPEAATQQLRNRINKKIKEEDLFKTAEEIFAKKWPSLKLYFMIGLPGETEEDIKAIAELAKQLAKLGRYKYQITVSLSTFVPKPHTPFQWEHQISIQESQEKIKFLRKMAWRYGFRIRWHAPEQSFLEGIFSRGDRRLHEVILRAWLKGARFDGWRDKFKFELWKAAFEDARLNPYFYLVERSKDEILPWEKIDIGVNIEFLWQERLKSQQGEITSDCRFGTCHQCGVCDFKNVSPIIHKGEKFDLTLEKSQGELEKHKYRLTFSKIDNARFFSHLELINIFHRAFRRAGLKLVYSKGFHPLPRISFALALPVGVESLIETVDVEVYGKYDEGDLLGKINPHLPQGLHITHAMEVPLETTLCPPSTQRFIIDFSPIGLNREKIKEFYKKESFVWQKLRNQKVKQVDLKKLVKYIKEKKNEKIEVALYMPPEGSIKITEAISTIFSLKEEDIARLQILKVGIEM
ncbi:MAG TPA: TIGR03960 family B12-binding radical SAM protein [Candidatus Desulfofervidus auxilii]|uniref:TIGR03960 family B12-binding radical SAM protein n=1 Tax=Desulfofervidus auxilii TaxID=1621989 RepID=A0A7V0IAC9_DESA2|nr:TIGR03960 family B12-binding radical SAM protein [Candidatus Desulfofervidus auxilii]